MGKSATGTGLRSFHSKSITALAWTSFVFAFAVGALLPGTFVGDWVREAFTWMPDGWGLITAVVVLVVGTVAAIVDVYVDLEPNQVAVYWALSLATLASVTSGGLADWMKELSGNILDAVDQALFAAAPDGLGSTALALASAVAVVLMTQRVISKKGRRG